MAASTEESKHHVILVSRDLFTFNNRGISCTSAFHIMFEKS